MITIAIDGNEANVSQRVGSNFYAFEIIKAMHEIVSKSKKYQVEVLLANPQVSDMPKSSENWQYRVITPKKIWTQWALPNHLFSNRKKYDLFYTPSHYAPKLCPVPYVSSVMDLAFLEYPQYFTNKDYWQLKIFTSFSVKNASKVIAISQNTKKEIIKHYKIDSKKIIVAYPALAENSAQSIDKKLKITLLNQHKIKPPFFLFVGTLQPRKNIPNLIKAFEIFSEKLTQRALKTKGGLKYSKLNSPVQLVIAGKKGWLSDKSQKAIDSSVFSSRIIQTGFVSDQLKSLLYSRASINLQLGIAEGFGLPALESLAHGTPTLVSNSSSLPEVVGSAGASADPLNPEKIAQAMMFLHTLPASKRKKLAQFSRAQASTFSWGESAKLVLQACEEVCKNN